MNDAPTRTAVITGASSGIGRAAALAFLQRPYRIWAVGRRPGALGDVRRAERPGMSTVIDAVADLRLEADVYELARRISAEEDRIDLLIHSAGVFIGRETVPLQTGSFDEVMAVHVRSRLLLTSELIGQIRHATGQVVFVNSSVSLQDKSDTGLYATSMHALRAATDSLRNEVNADGIRVLSLYLGRTATPMQERIHAAEGRPYAPDKLIQPETVANVIQHAIDLPRDAEITDLTIRPLKKPQPIPDELP